MIIVIQTAEVTSLKRDVDKQREQVSAADIKIKWNQNKLKAEQDAHKVKDSQQFYAGLCFSAEIIMIMETGGHGWEDD